MTRFAEKREKKNQILPSDCKQSSFDNVLHWLVLQWAPRFEGLDVWLKGLAPRISPMFPISLQPNWADRQQNRACLCLARFTSPKICICPPFHPAPPPPPNPVFIIREVTQAAAAASGATRSNKPEADSKLLLSQLVHPNNDWGLGSEDRPEGRVFFFPFTSSLLLPPSHYDANGHRWP